MSILDQFDGSAVPSRVRIYLRGGNVEASMLLSRRQGKCPWGQDVFSLNGHAGRHIWEHNSVNVSTERYRSDRSPSRELRTEPPYSKALLGRPHALTVRFTP